MKIVSIVSSYRQNGNTEQIVRLFEKNLSLIADKKHVSLEIEHISLCKKNISFCCGCRACFDKGENSCPMKDDTLNIFNSIKSADGIIMASPVYVEDVNGMMKNWIDRMAFNCHRPAFPGKCAAILTTSGAGSSNHSLDTMKGALNSWGFHVSCMNKFRMGAGMKYEQTEAQYSSDIMNMAEKLFYSIENNAALSPSLYNLISFNIQKRYYKACTRAGSYDRSYWQKKGWLDPGVSYYIPHNACRIKIIFAKIMGYFLSRYFI